MGNKQKKTMFFILAIISWVIAGLCIYIGALICTKAIEGNLITGVVLITAGAIATFIGYMFMARKIHYENIYEIDQEWGNQVEKRRYIQELHRAFENIKIKKNGESRYLHNQVWFDLKGDDLYRRLDSTKSFMGEFVLYEMLNKPLLKSEDIQNRQKKIKWMDDNPKKAKDIQAFMKNIGRDSKFQTVEFIYDGEYELVSKGKKMMLAVLSKLWILAVILGIKNVFLMVAAMPAIFTINSLAVKRINQIKEANASIGNKIGGMFVAAEKVYTLLKDEDEFKDEMITLKKYLDKCRCIKKNSSISVKSDVPGDPMIEMAQSYWDTVFLGSHKRMIKLLKYMRSLSGEVSEIFECVGEVEALTAVASYRVNNQYTVPEFLEDHEPKIEAFKMKHPLVADCIDNSVKVQKGMIITGSNMSGKSTFLRTIGIAQLMSQTIITVSAEKFITIPFRIASSIDIHDCLSEKKSYYFVEIENIKRILDRTESAEPVLILVDEILNGTNPLDRIAAATSILKYLSRKNCLSIVATHDMDIRDNLKDRFSCYYFTEDVAKDEMSFDYKIREGETHNRNALKLLRILDYPQEILGNL